MQRLQNFLAAEFPVTPVRCRAVDVSRDHRSDQSNKSVEWFSVTSAQQDLDKRQPSSPQKKWTPSVDFKFCFYGWWCFTWDILLQALKFSVGVIHETAHSVGVLCKQTRWLQELITRQLNSKFCSDYLRWGKILSRSSSSPSSDLQDKESSLSDMCIF